MDWKNPTSRSKGVPQGKPGDRLAKQRPSAGKVNLLEAVPVRSPQVRTEWEGGLAVLAFPRFKQRWVRRLFPKVLSGELRVALEEHGTAVWRLIDGKRTVEELIGLLATHFREDANYASRVVIYLLRLQKDGFIRLKARCD